MSAFIRRAERYAADYTDLGSGSEREKRLDFFLRGAFWMRSETEQALPDEDGKIWVKERDVHRMRDDIERLRLELREATAMLNALDKLGDCPCSILVDGRCSCMVHCDEIRAILEGRTDD